MPARILSVAHASRPTEAVSDAVSIVGLGNWGTALAYALHHAGIPVRQIILRKIPQAGKTQALQIKTARAIGAAISTPATADWHVKTIWICVPDDELAAVASLVAERTSARSATPAKRRSANGQPMARPMVDPPMVRQCVLHSSGVLSSSELAPVARLGAAVASVHPMMSFPRPAAVSLNGVPFGIEGDRRGLAVARRMVTAFGGEAIPLQAANKAMYHAFGAMCSPMLVSLLAAAEAMGRMAGLERKQIRSLMQPIVLATVANWSRDGSNKSFSGPIARGDFGTIERHLASLKSASSESAEGEQIAEIYTALARFAGAHLPTPHLPKANRAAFQRMLNDAQWPSAKKEGRRRS